MGAPNESISGAAPPVTPSSGRKRKLTSFHTAGTEQGSVDSLVKTPSKKVKGSAAEGTTSEKRLRRCVSV